jgi:hypothetical protein
MKEFGTVNNHSHNQNTPPISSDGFIALLHPPWLNEYTRQGRTAANRPNG